MKSFNLAQEVIGQAIHDFMGLSSDNPEDKEAIDAVNSLLELAHNGYTLVQWPESQELMEEDWFDKEAILDVDGKFGSSAYFVPIIRIF